MNLPYVMYLSSRAEQIELVFHTDAIDSDYVVIKTPVGSQFLRLRDVFELVINSVSDDWKSTPLWDNEKIPIDRTLDEFIEWAGIKARIINNEMQAEIVYLENLVDFGWCNAMDLDRYHKLLEDSEHYSRNSYSAIQGLKSAAYTHDTYDPRQTPDTEIARERVIETVFID